MEEETTIIDKIIKDSENEYISERKHYPEEEKEELLESLQDKINIHILMSFYEGQRDFSEEESIILLLSLDFIMSKSLFKGIILSKQIYPKIKTGRMILDRYIDQVEIEDDFFCTYCRYNMDEFENYYNEDEAFLGMCIALRYNSLKVIQFLEMQNVKKPVKITQENIYSAVGLWNKNKNGHFETYGDIRYWDVSEVTNMYQLFFTNYKYFNEDISRWDVSNVYNMQNMFGRLWNFNADISKWNVSKVRNMSHMFSNTLKFNCDLSKWNVDNVVDMSYMFYYSNFNSPLFKITNKSKVNEMESMFQNAVSFNQDISEWNVSNVIDMSHMFNGAVRFNQDISKWNVSNVRDMSYMFNGAVSFNQDISRWNIRNVRDMSYMFNGAVSFNQDISRWNVSNVTEIYNFLNGATAFKYDLSGWNFSSLDSYDKTNFYKNLEKNSILTQNNI